MTTEVIEGTITLQGRGNPGGDWTLGLDGDRTLRIADGSFLHVEPRIGQPLRAVLVDGVIVEMELDGRDAFTSMRIHH